MMRGILLAAAATILATPSLALAASAPSQLLGTWALDLTSMSIPPEVRPASVTLTLADFSTGEWQVKYVIVGKDGGVRTMMSRDRLDGTSVAIIGDQMEADSVALSQPASNVLVMGLAKQGRPGSVRIYTVAADARSMTESAANVGDDGKPFVRTFRWTRTVPRN